MIEGLGDRVREARELRRISQADAARGLGVSRATINGYEHGTAVPSAEMLIQLTRFYCTSADNILGIENQRVLLLDDMSEKERELLDSFMGLLKKVREKGD